MIHAFAYRDKYLVLDTESGSVHQLDRQSYEIVRAMETGNDVYALPYSNSEIDEVLSELDELRKLGQFDSPAPAPVIHRAEYSPIKSMCLNIAHDCNLRCAYCFAETGEFHGGRMLMSIETAKAALDFLIAHSMGRHNLEVDLFGGEPLMNFEVVKQTVAYGRELEKKHNKCIHFTITTNGVALNDEIIDFINKEMFNLVISIDGRRNVHDALRVTPNGQGSYDIIVPKAQKLISLRKKSENPQHYVRGTFTANNLDFTEDVKALTELGFTEISVEPVVLPPDNPCAITENNIETALAEYDRLADFVIEKRKAGEPFNFFHFMVDLNDSPCLAKRSLGCGAGVEYVAVSPDGNVYPCHQFVGNKDFLLGNVRGGELDNSVRTRFAGCNIFTKENCSNCWAKYFCSGGCAANAHNLNGSIMQPPKISCELLKKRTELALGLELIGE